MKTMSHSNECTSYNFFDELYNVFKSKRTTAVTQNDLIKSYRDKYRQTVSASVLRQIPFIQIKTNKYDTVNKMCYLVIELDDCCDQGNKCKYQKDCNLLHFANSNDEFKQLYPECNDANTTITRTNRHFKRKQQVTFIKLSPLKIPNISLEQRITNILNESTSIPKQLTYNEMRKIHNQKYPEFESHSPTLQAILLRFPSIFNVEYDIISFNELIPEQTNKYYVSISISPQWTDQKLIVHLMNLIKNNFPYIQIYDIYVKNVRRLAYFSTQSKFVVDTLLQSVDMKCCGRTVSVRVVSDRIQRNATRVMIDNLPCVFVPKDFHDWVGNTTGTREQIYGLSVIFSKTHIGSSECILVLNDEKDAEYIVKKMQNVKFRGIPLHLRHWYHPYNTEYDQFEHNTTQQHSEEYQFRNDSQISKQSKPMTIYNKIENILNGMSKETFKIISQDLKSVIENEIESEQQTENIIGLILQFAIENMTEVNGYVNLCVYLQEYFSDMNQQKTITNMIVDQTFLLFENSITENVFAIIELIAQLYNKGLLRTDFIFNNILKRLLKTHIEAFCKLLMKCGRLLDREESKLIDKYLKKLIKIQKKFKEQKMISLIDDVITMRNNGWISNDELEQMYNTLESKYRTIYLKQESMRKEMNKLMQENEWMKQSEKLKGKFRELEMNQHPTKMQMNTLLNQYKKLKIKCDKLEKITTECNSTNYMEFDANDIANWMVHLDKDRYDKYYIELKKNLVHEKIDGKCLEKIDRNDLHRFGIIQFVDKCDIFNAIQKLINPSITCPACQHSWE